MRRRLILFLIAIIGYCIPICSQQKGKASYYSKRATGARTASGERLHHDSLTCAHRSYPFGTMLKVTNLSNKKSVVVRVTDRGPFIRGRIIDLSWGAAKAIGMLSQGVVSVKVEVVEDLQIPMRPNDKIDLPLIDFEMAESSYDFKEGWKNWDETDLRIKSPEKQTPPLTNPSKGNNTSGKTTTHKNSTHQAQTPKGVKP